MNSDLIFHVVSRRKWPELNKNGYYQPEDFDETGIIECVEPGTLQEYLNKEHRGRKNLFLLVIDTNRLISKPKKAKYGLRMLNQPVNTDAILDKIRLDCNKDKMFDLDVKIS